jgi:hypothetical protein
MKAIYLMTSYLVENSPDVYVEQTKGLLAKNAVDVRPTMLNLKGEAIVDAVVVVLNSKKQSATFFAEMKVAKQNRLPVFYILQLVVAEQSDAFAELRHIDPSFHQSMHYSQAELVSSNSSFGQFLNYRNVMYPKIQRTLTRLNQQPEFKTYLLERGVEKELLEVDPNIANLTANSIVSYHAIINALVNPEPIPDSVGLTFLDYMVVFNEVAIVDDLLKANKQNVTGQFLVDVAAENNHHEMMRVLYVAGADISKLDPEYLGRFDKIYPGLRPPQSHYALSQSQIPAGQPQQLSGQKRVFK